MGLERFDIDNNILQVRYNKNCLSNLKMGETKVIFL